MKFSLRFLLLCIVPYTVVIAAVLGAGWPLFALALASAGLNGLLILWAYQKRREFIARRQVDARSP